MTGRPGYVSLQECHAQEPQVSLKVEVQKTLAFPRQFKNSYRILQYGIFTYWFTIKKNQPTM